jgi:hypothetical protein
MFNLLHIWITAIMIGFRSFSETAFTAVFLVVGMAVVILFRDKVLKENAVLINRIKAIAAALLFVFFIGIAIYGYTLRNAPIEAEMVVKAHVSNLEYTEYRNVRNGGHYTKCQIDFLIENKIYKFLDSNEYKCRPFKVDKDYQIRLVRKKHFAGNFLDYEYIAESIE